MKKLAFILCVCIPLLSVSKVNFIGVKNTIKHDSGTIGIHTDSLPPCIIELSHPAYKSIRSTTGAKQFKTELSLKNGQKLYAFNVQASIGCHLNETASIKYYDDACKHIATFYQNFTLKTGRKPFIASGYSPEDFPETMHGDYPSYYAQQKSKTTNASMNNGDVTSHLFATEKSFKIIKEIDTTFPFIKGDVIRISTAEGLKHFRNTELVNTYKIMPQIVAETTFDNKQIVYYMGTLQKFINVNETTFLISSEHFEDIVSPTTPILVHWEMAYDLEAEQ